MTSKLKCPFCQQELHKDPDGYYSCYTDNCSVMSAGGNGASGTETLWQALIRRTNQLNIAITDIHHAYKSLMGGCAEWRFYLEQTLKQIQDLEKAKAEQIDHKEI